MNKHCLLVRSKLDPVAVRLPQLCHPIQRRTADQQLRRLACEPARRHPLTKKRLEPKHGGLGHAPAMIATLPLPSRASDLANAAQILVASQPFSLGIAMLPN